MQQLCSRFLAQLDSLVLYLGLSHKDVFNVVARRHAETLPKEPAGTPAKLSTHQTQVAHAVFLLGYSYAEVFLNDLAHEIYLNHPVMLPGDDRIRFRQILAQSSYDDLISYMIDTKLVATFKGSMREIVQHFESTLKLTLRPAHRDRMIEASLIRNCIVHKMAIADERLATHSPRWTQGEEIELTIDDVRGFGILARKVAIVFTEQANEQYAPALAPEAPAESRIAGSGAGRGLSRDKVIAVPEEERGVVGKAAKRLGVSPKRLYRLLKHHNIQARKFR